MTRRRPAPPPTDVRESSMLTGGPRNGRAYWTDSLARNVNANRSNSEGYERSDEFVGNEAAPGGTSRIWWYRG